MTQPRNVTIKKVRNNNMLPRVYRGIGSRLGLGFTVVVVLTLVLGITALVKMNELADVTVKMYEYPMTVSNAVRDITTNITAMHRCMKDVVLAKNDKELAGAEKHVAEHEQDVLASFKLIDEWFLGDKQDIEVARQAFCDWRLIRQEVIGLKHQDRRDEASVITKGKAAAHVVHMTECIQKMSDFASSKATEFFDNAQGLKSRCLALVSALLLVIVGTCILTGILITRSITKPIDLIVVGINKLTRGKLDYKINLDRDDEIGELSTAFDKMTDRLKSTTASRDELDAVNQQLIRSESKSKRLIEADVMGIITSTIAGDITEANDEFLRMVGYAREEVVSGKVRWRDMTPAEYAAADEKAIKELATTRIMKAFEKEYIRKDGTRVPVLLGGAMLEGSTDNVICYVLDMTAQKRAEDLLHLQAEIASNMSEGVYTVRLNDGMITYTNPAFEEMFGYDPGEMLGKHVSIVNAPVEKTPKDTAREIMDLIEKNGYWRGDIKNVKKDGSSFWCYASVSVFNHSEHGNVLVSTHTDITERRQAEEALHIAEERNRSLVSILTSVVWITDADGQFIEPQTAFAEFTGQSWQDHKGWGWANMIHPDDRDRVKKSWASAVKNKSIYHSDGRMMRANGKYCHFEAVAMPILDAQGKVREWGGTLKDVTKRKQAEERDANSYNELKQAHNKLKDMQSQIIQSEKLASIGQLAAGVAHEMNTPVGFVASNFETLQSYMTKFMDMLGRYEDLNATILTGTKEDRLQMVEDLAQVRSSLKIDFVLKDIQELFDESTEGLDRVTSIVQNLRDFSRVDQAEERVAYDLNDGIKASLIVGRNAIKYDADVVTEFGDIPPVMCNSGQVNQVLLNIMVNGAQAIKGQEHERKGKITVKTYATATDVVCEISDNGPGIPEDKLSKIFDPFFTTKPAGKGTGLGLSVSHDIIISKHKGQLSVDSTVGSGTTFTIKLPIKQPDAGDPSAVLIEEEIPCG
jgi:PAS domain S-box-containing protein